MAFQRRQGNSLAVDDIWQSVSLEERLDLISRSQASGFISSIITLLLVGSIAYGLDEIWLLVAAVGCSFFTFPLFSSHSWRTGKPSLILAYLAVRTLARRYAYAFDLQNIDIILIYRGHFKEILGSEEEEYNRQKNLADFGQVADDFIPVWIILMRGGVIVLSERVGGAKLEFITPIVHDTKLTELESGLGRREVGCVLDGSGMNKGKSIILKTNYKGAHYVFTKRFEQLVFEAIKTQETIENLRRKEVSLKKGK